MDWADVTAVADLTSGKALRVVVGDVAILVLKAEDQLFAIGNQCTHQGAGLDRGVIKIAGSVRTVTCPAHGSTFNLETGKVMRPPATKPVPVFDVKVEDGRVFVKPREENLEPFDRAGFHSWPVRGRGDVTPFQEHLHARSLP